MDPKIFKPLSEVDILNAFGRTDLTPIQIDVDYYKKLKTNLLVPSVNQAYSTAIEWVSKWFYSKFKEGFFKQTFLDASHLMDQFRKLRRRDLLSITKPACVISVDLDTGYNRENLDLYNLGPTLMTNRTSYRDAFFIDRDKHLFVSMRMEMLMFRFNFRMKFATRAMQMDCAKMCQLAFRYNGSEKHYLDIDYDVPEELLLQIAEDTGAGINTCNKIHDMVAFVSYLNKHSHLPFLYKFNTAKGHMDCFLKVPNNVVNIRTSSINIDNGSDHMMLKSDYEVSFSSEVRFPSIQFYSYYSFLSRESKKCINRLDSKSFVVCISNLSKIPTKDEHGWQWSIQTEYTFDEKEDHTVINFKDLIGDIRDVIDYTKSIAISPHVFLNLKLYNNFKEIPIHIDWVHYKITLLNLIENDKVFIVVYMDNEYFNNQIVMLRNYDKNRIQDSNIVANGQQINKISSQDSKS